MSLYRNHDLFTEDNWQTLLWAIWWRTSFSSVSLCVCSQTEGFCSWQLIINGDLLSRTVMLAILVFYYPPCRWIIKRSFLLCPMCLKLIRKLVPAHNINGSAQLVQCNLSAWRSWDPRLILKDFSWTLFINQNLYFRWVTLQINLGFWSLQGIC